MADTKISALTELAAAPAPDDLFVVDDVSDTSMAASGTDKKIKASTLGLPIIARKTADETVNNSSALQDDDHLVVPVVASGIYRVELALLALATSTTPDWKFGWTLPASATIRWGPEGTGGSPAVPWSQPATGSSPLAILTESDTAVVGSGAFTQGILILGILAIAGTAGNAQFRWAQNTATAADSKLLTNSFLIATKIG